MAEWERYLTRDRENSGSNPSSGSNLLHRLLSFRVLDSLPQGGGLIASGWWGKQREPVCCRPVPVKDLSTGDTRCPGKTRNNFHQTRSGWIRLRGATLLQLALLGKRHGHFPLAHFPLTLFPLGQYRLQKKSLSIRLAELFVPLSLVRSENHIRTLLRARWLRLPCREGGGGGVAVTSRN